ncbi:PhlB family protein [Halocalculus aciditolerans]|uniref:Nucleic acid-binding protein n=1 Tax=Halocalculus aciditolerans TaxID=1383812 RepID=A0A830F2U4_9EURY|nr:nucleic acid-binding protein [Halocalculus aciditolerans]GGL57215.1 hypothetical protein GCM10009039_14280 [Halocalculus aciditolerans]
MTQNENASFDAHVCENGHVTYPGHPRCPTCGREQVATIDLRERDATVVTWTTSTATPPGVRSPNTIVIVEFDLDDWRDAESFDLDDSSVRAIGQCTTDDVETGDTVTPVYVDELRDPDQGIRIAESQEWDGYRFEPR